MAHQCYYCERLFESKENLYDHLDIHAKPTTINEKKNMKKKKLNN